MRSSERHRSKGASAASSTFQTRARRWRYRRRFSSSTSSRVRPVQWLQYRRVMIWRRSSDVAMPLYEYECREHGIFDEHRTMDESEASASCPACGGDARRILSAPRLRCTARAESTARDRNERSSHEPRVVAAKGVAQPQGPLIARTSAAGG